MAAPWNKLLEIHSFSRECVGSLAIHIRERSAELTAIPLGTYTRLAERACVLNTETSGAGL